MSDDILEQAARWRAEGRRVALATVVATWGSSPRPVGSTMAVDEAGAMAGSVSGGCIEGAVVHEARKTMEDGEPRLLSFGVTDEMAWEVGLACGGKVQVYVEAVAQDGGMTRDILDRLLKARADKVPVALVTDLSSGLQSLVFHDAVHGGFGLEEHHLAEIRARLRQDHSGLVEFPDIEGYEDEGPRLFVHAHNPPLRLIVVGAVHIAQLLARMAGLAGYAVTVIDPRAAFATEARFPGVELVQSWPDEALGALAIDARTAVVTLTHDAKLDDPALMVALRSPAFYVGSLGSCRTHAKRLDRLSEQGLSEAELKRIHAPVGLDIGAETPAEIAVSIIAQVVAARRNAL
ncbi:MAG TPA: XdhC/CoxI family protein [Azospirillum sp.]|nr:XdhC/CoxI family protein [Azospirillum sp.]